MPPHPRKQSVPFVGAMSTKSSRGEAINIDLGREYSAKAKLNRDISNTVPDELVDVPENTMSETGRSSRGGRAHTSRMHLKSATVSKNKSSESVAGANTAFAFAQKQRASQATLRGGKPPVGKIRSSLGLISAGQKVVNKSRALNQQ